MCADVGCPFVQPRSAWRCTRWTLPQIAASCGSTAGIQPGRRSSEVGPRLSTLLLLLSCETQVTAGSPSVCSSLNPSHFLLHAAHATSCYKSVYSSLKAHTCDVICRTKPFCRSTGWLLHPRAVRHHHVRRHQPPDVQERAHMAPRPVQVGVAR